MGCHIFKFKVYDNIKYYYSPVDGSSAGTYPWAVGDKYLYALVYGSKIPLDSGIYINNPYQWLWWEKKGKEKKYLFKAKYIIKYH